MTISCIGCTRKEFIVNPADIDEIGIVSFVCPSCGVTTAVHRRDGGGYVVGQDQMAAKKSG